MKFTRFISLKNLTFKVSIALVSLVSIVLFWKCKIEKNNFEFLLAYNLSLHNHLVDPTQFECLKTRKILEVQPTMCIHDPQKDIYVSKTIKEFGIYEPPQVELFMKILQHDSSLQVLDVGANIGLYTLYAAKLGRLCVCVEPFEDNLIRLHASAILENTTDRIIVVKNGVSNKRGEFKSLVEREDKNIGGHGVIDQVSKNSKYNLVTIHLDDLCDALPEHGFSNAIMKIDIEGYEFKAFKHASKLLSRVNVPVIFMEWLGKYDEVSYSYKEVRTFLENMRENGYYWRSSPNLTKLDTNSARCWGTDIILFKKEYFELINMLSIH
jgi:FkbM family methyltransferase